MTSYDFFLNGVLFQVGTNNTVQIAGVEPGDVVSVQIVDPNGCTDDTELELNVHPAPTSQLQSNQGFEICEGDTVTFSNGGNGLVNHNFIINGQSQQNGSASSWTTSALNDQDSVMVGLTDTNGCTGTSNLIIMDVIPIPPTPNILQTLDSLEATVYGTIYEWKRNDTTTSVTTQYYTNYNDGIYTVRVYQNGCWSAWSDPLTITGTGLAALDALNVRIYPSPAYQHIFIQLTYPQQGASIDRISVIDMLGKTVYTDASPAFNGGQPMAIDIQHLPSGIYSILIEAEGERIAVPIVKEMR